MQSVEVAHRRLLFFAFVVPTVLGVGCDRRGVGTGLDAGTPDDLSRGAHDDLSRGAAHPSHSVSVPTEHRSVPMSCPAPRASMGCSSGGACKTDADCTAGRNGRCNSGVGFPCSCTYDPCNNDSDCPSGQDCACAIDVLGRTGTNSIAANCRTDADCGAGGFCSPSLTAARCQLSIDGYYCHTPNDECGTDADCPQPDASDWLACVYKPALGHWACAVLGSVCAG